MVACPPGASACGDEAGELWAYAAGGSRGEVTGAAPLAEGGRGLGGPSAPGEGSRPLLTPAHRLLGRRDSSGIRLHYTATLRRFNAGIMELGLVYTPVMAVPPREEAFVLTGYCTDKCTQLVSGAGPGCPAEAPQVQVGAEGGRSVALVPLPRIPLGPSALLSLRSRNQAPTSPTPRVSASGRRVLKHMLLPRVGQTRVPHQELRGAPQHEAPGPSTLPRAPRERLVALCVPDFCTHSCTSSLGKATDSKLQSKRVSRACVLPLPSTVQPGRHADSRGRGGHVRPAGCSGRETPGIPVS